MANEFDLKMVSDLSIHQAKCLVAELLKTKLGEWGSMSTPDIAVTGGVIEPGYYTAVTEECFHFTPSWIMGFRPMFDGGYEEFYRLMLRAAMLLLAHGRDAVLLSNYEHIVFQRLGGTLVFNVDMTAHVEEIIKQEVHIPYESRSLPSPLL